MALGGLAITLMLVHVTLDILLKFFFSMPINGTLEMVSAYYMVAAVFLPLGIVQRARGHILVEVFTQHLAPRAIAGFSGVSGLIGMLFLAALTVMSGIEAVNQTLRLERLDIVFFYLPVWPSRWFLPIGCGVFTFYLLLHSVVDCVVAVTGRNLLPGQAEPAPSPLTRINE